MRVSSINHNVTFGHITENAVKKIRNVIEGYEDRNSHPTRNTGNIELQTSSSYINK